MTKNEIEQLAKEFVEYKSEGYSGGKDGVRCWDCDGKYSGDVQLNGLCPVCKARKLINTLLDTVDRDVIKKDEKEGKWKLGMWDRNPGAEERNELKATQRVALNKLRRNE